MVFTLHLINLQHLQGGQLIDTLGIFIKTIQLN